MKHSFNFSSCPFIGLLSILLLCLGCTRFSHSSPPWHQYHLLLEIHDKKGIDIVKEIPILPDRGSSWMFMDKEGWMAGVEPDLCHFDYVVPELCFKFETSAQLVKPHFAIVVTKIADRYFLLLQAHSTPSCPPVDIITFKLTCPFIFGDDVEHLIVSYWSPNGLKMRPFVNGNHGTQADGFFPRNECYVISIDDRPWFVKQELFYYNLTDEFKRSIEERKLDKRLYVSAYASVAQIVID